MPRVLVICHNPTSQGNIVWEGHEIVGYVDILPRGRIAPNAPYYQGWDSIPADLVGTVDIGLALHCPVVETLQGKVRTFDVEELRIGTNVVKITITNDIFRRGFSYLKPGGYMLFANIETELVDKVKTSPVFQSEFGAENIESIGAIPAITQLNVRNRIQFDRIPFMKITKRVAGGRRRKTRRARRSKKTLRRRR